MLYFTLGSLEFRNSRGCRFTDILDIVDILLQWTFGFNDLPIWILESEGLHTGCRLDTWIYLRMDAYYNIRVLYL